ncbi:MAG: AMP-binding protein [Proteobacteria bacterium]|nr:AMP-binding protein [Pseudomonadota bacterium]
MFIILFWASLLGKIVPVPLSLANTDEYRLKLHKVCEVLGNPFVASDGGVSDDFEAYLIRGGQGELLGKFRENRVFPGEFTTESGEKNAVVRIETPAPGDTADIQFSSGSTGDPKGVVLTHDLGLIGWHLNPLVAHVAQYLMLPKTFVGNPAIWIDKISEHRVSATCSPGFGFYHFLKFAETDRGNAWDLSCVRIILSGAEHISIDLYNAFLEEMGPFGLKRNAIMPAYGLAEATLTVSVSPLAEAFTTH